MSNKSQLLAGGVKNFRKDVSHKKINNLKTIEQVHWTLSNSQGNKKIVRDREYYHTN